MKGAVQGWLPRRTSTPVKKSLPVRSVASATDAGQAGPNCTTPERLRPTASITYTRPATTSGCCGAGTPAEGVGRRRWGQASRPRAPKGQHHAAV